MMTVVSSRDGISDDEILHLTEFETNPLFGPIDRLVLRYATLMSQTPVRIEDEVHHQLAEHFTPKQIVELTAVIAFENFRARMNHAFGVESGGFARTKTANA